MDSKRSKYAAEWFYSKVFGAESIRPRFFEEEEKTPLPAALKAARSLEMGMSSRWQNRNVLFVKQGKLLASYEDDYVYEKPVLHYFPTYQALSDAELRGYFTWRTKLRRGDIQKTSLAYAFLYIYELLNQIGVEDPEEGYRKLLAFREAYGSLDWQINTYLNRWLKDYTVYYCLDPALISDTPAVRFHNAIAVLAGIHDQSDADILAAVRVVAPTWLKRSKFYREQQGDMDTVLVRVLKRMSEHYAKGKRSMAEQFFGNYASSPVQLFESAVFYDRMRDRCCQYRPDNSRVFTCRNGVWSVLRYGYADMHSDKLADIIKTVDAVMRPHFGYKQIKSETDIKWLRKLIDEEVQRLLEEKKEAEKKKITIDYSQLARIRRDSAATRDKLIVDEELLEEEEPTPLPEPQPVISAAAAPEGSALSGPQYRLLRCLLYGGSLQWVRQEGHILSVLADGINEALFDTFSDTVLTADEPPEVIEDYIDELKEMVTP